MGCAPSKPETLETPPEKTIEEVVKEARQKLGMDVNHHLNFAFVGRTGVGKSSLINSIRKYKDAAKGAARVGETETTTEIQKYSLPDYPYIVLWDLPGAGTLKHPMSTYFEDKMIYAFDCILVITDDRFQEFDFQIAKKAMDEYKRPCAFVRNKTDVALKEKARREDKSMRDVSTVLRKEVERSFQEGLKKSGFSAEKSVPLFLVCASRFRIKNAYVFYNQETEELDKSLTRMDEERLLLYITESVEGRIDPRAISKAKEMVLRLALP